MPRYIDADALKERFEDFATYSYGEIEYKIDATPTVDVQEVKHGFWKKGMCGNYFVCSECAQISDFFEFDYCPGCGARMDKKEREK